MFSDYMILYIANPKDATRKVLQLINELGKVAEYKINAQKSLAFLYITNYQKEKLSNKLITFIITSKRIKYLGINLRK